MLVYILQDSLHLDCGCLHFDREWVQLIYFVVPLGVLAKDAIADFFKDCVVLHQMVKLISVEFFDLA